LEKTLGDSAMKGCTRTTGNRPQKKGETIRKERHENGRTGSAERKEIGQTAHNISLDKGTSKTLEGGEGGVVTGVKESKKRECGRGTR